MIEYKDIVVFVVDLNVPGHAISVKQCVNLVANYINIISIEIIIIKCISDEVVYHIPLVFSEQIAVDLLGKLLVSHGWLFAYTTGTLSGAQLLSPCIVDEILFDLMQFTYCPNFRIC